MISGMLTRLTFTLRRSSVNSAPQQSSEVE
jgi:hypothetical protein